MSGTAADQSTKDVTPAKPGSGAAQPEAAPAQPVDTQAQEEAGRDRAEGGGYT